MDTTRASLIIRVRNHADSAAWSEFDQLYGPLIYRYAKRRGLSRDDAEEVKSLCMTAVVQQIGSFEYDRAQGGFKNWLRRIAHNKITDVFRKRRERIADSQEMRAWVDDDPGPDEIWDQNWQRVHLKFCVEQVRSEVSPQNYQAFHMLVFDETPVEEVCRQLGMNSNRVYKAKSNLIARIREKMAELGLEE